MDLVVVGEPAGEFPDALLGAALLPGVYGIIDETNPHRFVGRGSVTPDSGCGSSVLVLCGSM